MQAGGRRRKVPADKADVLVLLEKMCTAWVRWRASLGLDRGDGGSSPVRSRSKSLRERIDSVGKEIGGLHRLIETQLAEEKPTNMTRAAAQGLEPSGR